LETGADDYITKPFEAQELLVRIKNLIDQRKRLQEYFQRELMPQLKGMDLNSLDEKFLTQALEQVQENLDNSKFSVEKMADEMHMSRRHLSRKLSALTGQSGQLFIRSVRLKHSARMLQTQSDTITQVAYKTGFSNPAHFTSSFKQEFGVLPSAYMKKHTREHPET